MMTNSVGNVVAGVATHADTHHAAVVSITGALLGDAEFPRDGVAGRGSDPPLESSASGREVRPDRRVCGGAGGAR
ncbi:hypothetical protein [Pseudoclavibacter helvolus]|uniref:hypothetical protein n=1 Tax=Pseudoclavibacter helvolus TaxID=255205 RepID=UPI003734DDCE